MKKKKMINFLVFTFVLIFSATNLLARPILDQSFEPELNTILEDAADISGNNIDAIIIEGSIEDPLGSSNSMAVIAVDNSNGVWQYSLDNGNNWQNFTTETESYSSFPEAAILLSGSAMGEFTNKIRFLPKAGYPDQNANLPNIDGNATFEFVAWNEIEGNAGDSADTTAPDSEIFSLDSDFASITVSAVNDDPSFHQNQIEITDNYEFPEAIYEGVAHNLDSADFSVADTDIANNQLILEFYAENGVINFPTAENVRFISGNNTNNVTLVTTIALMNQLLNNFTYTADSQFSGTETISVRLNDQGKSGIGGGEDINRNILVEVMLRNHAPVLHTEIDHTLASILEDDFNNSGTFISDIITSESITDINQAEANRALAIIGVDNSDGIWQYSIDGGSSFQDISAITGSYVDLTSNSLLLNGELENTAATLLRFVPAPDFFGTANLRFRAWDLSQYSSGQFVDTTENGDNTAFSADYDTASIETTNVNDAPELLVENNVIDDEVTISVPISDPFIYNFSSDDAIDVSDIDVGGGQIIVNILTSKGTLNFPASGRYVSNNGTNNVTLAGRITTINDYLDNFIYTANPGEEGYETLELIINDFGSRAQITRYITFQISNIPPVFTSTPVEDATEDNLYSYNITAEDDDDSQIFFDSVTLPEWLNLTDNGDGTALLSGTPVNDHVGANPVEIILYDSFTADSPISQSFSIDVQNINDAAYFVSEPITEIEQSALYNYQIITNDIDPTNDALVITITDLPAWLTFTDNGDRTALLSGTPQNDDVGIYDITLQVSDGIATPATEQNFQIEVINLNDAPYVENALVDFSFAEDTSDNSIDLSSVFSDIDLTYGDELAYSYSDNENIAVEIDQTTGIVTLTPAADWVGEETITFMATDLSEATVSDDVMITITNVNDAAYFVSEPITEIEQSALYSYQIITNDIDPTNDALVITITDLPAWLTFTDNGDRTALLSGTPQNDDVGIYDITLQVSDGIATPATEQNFQIEVINLNDAPYVENALVDFSFAEDTSDNSIDLSSVFSDLDLTYGDELAYNYSDNENIAVEIDQTTGIVTLTPAADWVGEETITFVATDLSEATVSDDVMITITNVNDAAYFVSEPITEIEQSALYSYQIITNDIDPTNDALVITITDLPAWLSFTDNGDRTALLSGTPQNDDVGIYDITLQVSDGIATPATEQNFQIEVSNLNDAPYVENALVDFSFAEDTSDNSIDLSSVFSDIDLAYGDELAYSYSDNENIAVEIDQTTSIVTLTPAADWVGEETITFIATDLSEATVSDDVIITITNLNDAPHFTSTPITFTTEDNLYTYNITYEDVDPAPILSLQAVTLPAWLSFTDNGDGTAILSGTPDNSEVGSHPVSLVLSDNIAADVEQNFVVNVDNMNNAPVVANPISDFSIDEDSIDNSIDLSLVFDDDDLPYGDVLSYSVSGNDFISVDIDQVSGIVTLTPQNDWVGNETITFTATDQDGLAISDEVIISINNLNDAPTVSTPLVDFSFDEDTMDQSIDLSNVFTDADLAYGDALTYSFSGNNQIAVEIDPTTGIVTLTPATDWFGEETLTFTATDLDNETASDEVVVTINNVNDAPEINLPANFTFEEDGSLIEDFTTYLSDIDSADFTLSVSGNSEVNVEIDGLQVTFTATTDWSGTETLTFTVNDNFTRATASADLDVIVTPVNDLPVVVNPLVDFSFDEETIDQSIDLSNVFTDADLAYGDLLTYSFSGNDQIAVEIDPTTGIVTLTPATDWFGAETLTFTATDLEDETASDEVVVTINNVNDAPVINLPANFTFEEDGSLIEDFTTYLSDVDSADFTLSVSGNSEVNVEIDGLQVTFTATADWSGTETLTFTVNDNFTRATASADLDLIVTPVNDTPVVVTPLVDFSFDEDTTDDSINLSNVFTDADLTYGDELEFSVTGDENITVEIDQASGIVTLTPVANWFGEETLIFTATDLEDETASNDVIITINNVNDDPVINPPANFTFEEDSSLEVDFINYVSDPDPHELTLTVSGNINTIVEINNFNVTFTATAEWSGTETLTFTVNDNNTRATASADLDLIVTPVNDVPVVVNPLVDFSFDENTTDDSIVLSNVFTDTDLTYGDELEFSVSGDENIAVEIDQTTGLVTLTPATNWFGEETLTFTATDLEGETASDEVVITINNVNDAPEINLPVSLTFEEDDTLSEDFSAYVSDIDSENLTLTVSGNSEVNVEIVGLDVTFTATADWSGTETLTFTVNDNYARATASADLDLIVTPVNDAPVVVNSLVDFSFDEDTTDDSIDLSNVFTDADLTYGDELEYSVSGDENIAVEIDQTTGIVTLTPATNWFGAETLTFTATDLEGETASDEVVITINNVNNAPEINLPASLTFEEDDTLSEDFSAYVSDIDSENLTLTVSGNSEVNVEIVGLDVTFTATADWSGTETLTFTVNDNYTRATASADLDLIVTPVNDAPVVVNSLVDFSFDEDTTDDSIDLSNVFTDADLTYGDELEYSVSGDENIAVEIDQTTGIVTLTPATNWFGEETLTFTATDLDDETASDEVVITINNVNNAPEINLPASLTFEEDDTLSEDFSAYVSDIDSENLTLTVSGNSEVNVEIVGLDVTFTATADWSGTETLTFTVNDNYTRATASADLDLIVTPVNDAPVVVNSLVDFSFDEDTTDDSIDLSNVFTDADLTYGDELEYSVTGDENIAVEIDQTTGLVTLTPAADWFGEEILTFIATDLEGETASDEISITIVDVNDAPEVNEDFEFEISFSIDDQYTIDLNDVFSDSENSDLIFTLEFDPDKIMVEIIDLHILQITPVNSWFGTTSIVVTADDGQGNRLITECTFYVTINPISIQPNAFTPNGDGINDLFTIDLDSSALDPITLFIYNSKGRLIREIDGTASTPISWDGKDDNNNICRSAPYLFYIKQNGSRVQRGKVYLVR